MTSNWHLLYTLSNYEKKALDLLQRKNIEVYLPMNVEFRRWSDRMKKITVPLFPNYIFVNITGSESTSVLKTQGILKFVSLGGERAIVPFKDIDLIRKFCARSICMEVDNLLAEGDFVEIESGPFTGLQGILYEKKGKTRFGVNVCSLGKNVSIDICGSQLRKLHPPVTATVINT